METVLALDLGKSTGWAMSRRHTPRTPGIMSGTWDLGAKNCMALRFYRLQQLLEKSLPPIDHIVTELPFVHAKSGQQSRLSVFGYVAIAMCFAAKSGITLSTVAPTAVKKWVAGSGKAPKVDMAMKLLSLYPKQEFTSLDQSDALGILIYYLDKKDD
tara:strand:- start:497 stop:967 length:471 start_codon:yes stop_codon:yes gene_type:complete